METTKIGIGSISFNGFKMGNFYIHFALNVMKGNVWKNLKLKQTSSEDSIHPHFKKRNNIFFPVGFKSQYSKFSGASILNSVYQSTYESTYTFKEIQFSRTHKNQNCIMSYPWRKGWYCTVNQESTDKFKFTRSSNHQLKMVHSFPQSLKSTCTYTDLNNPRILA